MKSELALRKIVEAGEVEKDDVILEIGPGRGALTKKLLEKAGLVMAIEKDLELYEFLKIKFAKEIQKRSLVLVHDDILKFDICEAVLVFRKSSAGKKFSQDFLLRNVDRSKTFSPLRFKIIANIPYNITGAILKKFLGALHQPTSMVLMVQHEVAKRIVGRNGPASAKATVARRQSLWRRSAGKETNFKCLN